MFSRHKFSQTFISFSWKQSSFAASIHLKHNSFQPHLFKLQLKHNSLISLPKTYLFQNISVSRTVTNIMAPRSCKQIDESVISSGFLDSFDYVLTDCDGVLWNENVPIPGSVETINTLNNMGKPVIYVTNNSTKSRVDYLKKCDTLGFPASMDTFVSTSYCVASYFKSINFKKKVYVIGTAGIGSELDKVGIPHLPIGPDPATDNWLQWVGEVKLDPEVGAVIVGFDHHVSYPKLMKAASYLKDPGNLFIATNRDEQYAEGNFIMPGTGTLVSAVEVVSGRKATTLGKPEKFILNCVKVTHPNIDFSRCLMVGDRLNTDVLLGTRHGLKTLFVGSGVSTLEEVRRLEQSADETDHLFVPDFYLPCLGDLLKFIKV